MKALYLALRAFINQWGDGGSFPRGKLRKISRRYKEVYFHFSRG